MYEVHWTSHTILVSVPDTPSSARRDFEAAITIWNQAQSWFVRSYYPKDYPDDIFTIGLAAQGQSAQVTVQYVSSLSNGWWAETGRYGASILMVTEHSEGNVILATHELGHVLGLGDNSINGDLERGSDVQSLYPSTLNLYAVYLEVKCNFCYTGSDRVTLPSGITYFTWSPNLTAMPEFSNTPTMLGLLLGILCTASRRISLKLSS